MSKQPKKSKEEFLTDLYKMRFEQEALIRTAANLNQLVAYQTNIQNINDRINQVFLDSVDIYSKRISWLTIVLVVLTAVLGIETFILAFGVVL